MAISFGTMWASAPTKGNKNTPKLSFRGVRIAISQQRRAAERSDVHA